MGSGLLVIGALLVVAIRVPGRGAAVAGSSKTLPGQTSKALLSLFRRRGLIGPYVTIFAQYFSFGGVVTVLPVYIKEFGLESFHVGMMLAAFAVMFIIVQVPVGNMCDRRGRRGLSLIGIVLGITALALLPFFQTFAILAACTSLYGIAYGFIFPSTTAMLGDVTSPEERGLATGVFHALLTAGVAAGAPVMGWVAGIAGAPAGLGLSGSALFIALLVMLFTGRSSLKSRC
jgi:MFS family permease